MWPTPEAGAFGAADPEKITARRKRLAEKYGNNGFGLTLGQQVAVDMALWPTPTAQDGARGSGTIRPHDTGHPLPQRVAQALWSTPRASDGEKGGPNMSFGAGCQPLPAQAAALWATPNTIDAKGGTRTGAGQVQLCHQAAASGATPSGSPERTASPGALDPAFVSWLMGYPPEWLSCAPSAMRSSRKSRPK